MVIDEVTLSWLHALNACHMYNVMYDNACGLNVYVNYRLIQDCRRTSYTERGSFILQWNLYNNNNIKRHLGTGNFVGVLFSEVENTLKV